MVNKTSQQLKKQAAVCREVFINKNRDYGTSWRILRFSTFIDQIFIKATRIRNIEEGKIQLVEDDTVSEYIGIINYSVLTLIQLQLSGDRENEIDFNAVLGIYDTCIENALTLQEIKNHDYGEVWREMYISSFTDIILARILRIRNIIENDGITVASEGIDSNLYDIINYSFFALIKLEEKK